MKSIIKLTIMLVGFALLINSCSTKTNEEGKMIPKNAPVIVYFNTKSLLSKLSWDEIKQTNWFKEIYNDTSVNSLTRKIMDNPASTGIDLDAACVVFLQKNGDPKGQIVFDGTVKDAKTFETFNKTLDPSAVTVKDGDINLLTLKAKTVVGWSDKKFAYVTRNPGAPANMNFGGDGASNNAPSYNAGPDLSLVCKNLFALKADSNMTKTEKFATLLKEDGDFHLWQNTEELIKGSAPMGALSMLKLDVFLKDNISTYTVSFDNGKIDVKQKYYVSAELADVLKKYTEGSMNTDMVKNIPSQNLAGIITIHFKPEGISEIAKLTGMDGFLNMFLSKENLTIDDFVKAIRGESMFAVPDSTIQGES